LNETLSSSFTNLSFLESIDIEEKPEKAVEYRVDFVPTLIYIDDNNVEQKRYVGSMTAKQFQDFISSSDI
jgi:hypothetical protein